MHVTRLCVCPVGTRIVAVRLSIHISSEHIESARISRRHKQIHSSAVHTNMQCANCASHAAAGVRVISIYGSAHFHIWKKRASRRVSAHRFSRDMTRTCPYAMLLCVYTQHSTAPHFLIWKKCALHPLGHTHTSHCIGTAQHTTSLCMSHAHTLHVLSHVHLPIVCTQHTVCTACGYAHDIASRRLWVYMYCRRVRTSRYSSSF